MVQEEQEDEGEAADVNQVQPVIPAPQQLQSTPLTPPVLQGHVPAEHLPPAQFPSFVMTPLPPVQPSTRLPPPPPFGPPPSEESPPQISQPTAQQQAQPKPSVPSQQSLPSTHRCPDVHGPAAPVISRRNTYQGESLTRASPRTTHRLSSSSCMTRKFAWSYTRQVYRNSPHAAQAVEAQPLPTSAGVSEPSLCQHSHVPPHYQWAAGSTAGASTSLSHAGAFPAMAVNTGSGAPVAPDGSGGMGSQPNTQPPTQPRMEQPISKNKSPLPKLNIKGGDLTSLTRVINEWIQKTAIALNTWSIEASNFWNQSVNSARQQHNAPQDRATHIGLPTSFQALPTQVPVLEATMRAELTNSVLPEKVTSIAMQKGALKVHELLFLTFRAFCLSLVLELMGSTQLRHP